MEFLFPEIILILYFVILLGLIGIICFVGCVAYSIIAVVILTLAIAPESTFGVLQDYAQYNKRL